VRGCLRERPLACDCPLGGEALARGQRLTVYQALDRYFIPNEGTTTLPPDVR
jgi:hypothetical protein